MPSTTRPHLLVATFVIALMLAPGGSGATARIETVPGMPPVTDPTNLYSETTAGKLSPALANVPARVYVPNVKSDEVHVIDPVTFKVIDRFKVGKNPQHVVPSWDLTTLWVTNNAEGRTDGTLTPIDPVTGKPGKDVVVDDPYNMYFTPDGASAVIVAEAMKRLDFRDAKTMALQGSVSAPKCGGINHGDFSIDGRYLIMTCEYVGRLAKIDWRARKVLGYLTLPDGGIPQDIRVSPDGAIFYVADLKAGGVHLIDGDAFKTVGFITTGVGTLNSLATQNIILLGTPGITSRHLKKVMEATNFYYLGTNGSTVLNRNPRPGEAARYDEVIQSDRRRTALGIIALLPGKGSGTLLLTLTGRYTSPLASFLITPQSLDQFEAIWQKEGSPAHFELLVQVELDGDVVLKSVPIAMRQLNITY